MTLMMIMSIHPPCARVPRSNKTSQAASLENQTPSPDDDDDDDDDDGDDDVSGRQFGEPNAVTSMFSSPGSARGRAFFEANTL